MVKEMPGSVASGTLYNPSNSKNITLKTNFITVGSRFTTALRS